MLKTLGTDAVVSDRLAERRARLQRLSDVDPVRQQLRIGSYYNLARQLYRQSETYYRDGALDNAYVQETEYRTTIPAHHDYDLPTYRKEKLWINLVGGLVSAMMPSEMPNKQWMTSKRKKA
ncbi:hypothetical protein P43SY_009720 [Pythium insidiosum]|uniref:USP8 dimerisation domain-containing protein n=1 Tax=Pythium insidiosum TaxID=114742 RepID=A0AAD5LM44_PYTIN|nr:hypothetical protein P43SY_009720 [Pythium insidiosum]